MIKFVFLLGEAKAVRSSLSACFRASPAWQEIELTDDPLEFPGGAAWNVFDLPGMEMDGISDQLPLATNQTVAELTPQLEESAREIPPARGLNFLPPEKKPFTLSLHRRQNRRSLLYRLRTIRTR